MPDQEELDESFSDAELDEWEARSRGAGPQERTAALIQRLRTAESQLDAAMSQIVRHNNCRDEIALSRSIANDLALAVMTHRRDMHNKSSRPCSTCKQSEMALRRWIEFEEVRNV